MNYDSKFKNFANQSINWIRTDDEQLYKKNLITRYEELEKNGWIDNHFTYSFNSLGFRCKEFINEPTLMSLGCSYTMGTGLPVEHVWPEMLSQKLNMHCANLGIAGGSHDTAFRLCHGYIGKIKPKIVVLLKPPPMRFELVFNNNIENLGPWVTNPLFGKIKQFWEKWSIDNNNSYFNIEKNILAIELLCFKHGIKFLQHDLKDMGHSKSRARDLRHMGIEGHKFLVDKILSNI